MLLQSRAHSPITWQAVGGIFSSQDLLKNSESHQNVCILWDYFVLFVRRAWNRACKATLSSSLIKLKGGRGHNEPPRRWVTHATAITHIKHAYKRQPCAHIHTHRHTQSQGQVPVIEKQQSKLIVMTRFTEGHFVDACFLFLRVISDHLHPAWSQTNMIAARNAFYTKNQSLKFKINSTLRSVVTKKNPLTTKHFAHHPVPSAVEWPQEEEDWMQAGKSEVKGVKQRVARARRATPLLSVQVSSLSFVWTEQEKKKRDFVNHEARSLLLPLLGSPPPPAAEGSGISLVCTQIVLVR